MKEKRNPLRTGFFIMIRYKFGFNIIKIMGYTKIMGIFYHVSFPITFEIFFVIFIKYFISSSGIADIMKL
jgi:hypothetical protein